MSDAIPVFKFNDGSHCDVCGAPMGRRVIYSSDFGTAHPLCALAHGIEANIPKLAGVQSLDRPVTEGDLQLLQAAALLLKAYKEV